MNSGRLRYEQPDEIPEELQVLPDKTEEREQIDKLMKNYLTRGGKITKVAPGVGNFQEEDFLKSKPKRGRK